MINKKIHVNLVLLFLSVPLFMAVWHIICVGIFLHSSNQYVNIPIYTHNTIDSMYTYPIENLSASDYGKLMNITDFKFNMVTKCYSDLLLLVTVFSTPKNFKQRKSIRQTWGESMDEIKVVFVLDSIKDLNLQEKLKEENKLYKDLVQGNYSDIGTYKVYKYITAFKYAIYHCPQAKYILKVNDDVFVNMPTMLVFLYTQLTPFGARNLLLCTPLANKVTKKIEQLKWIAPFPEYKDSYYYPPYCDEWSSLYSQDVVFTLYQELQKLKHFWVDDLLTTGVMAKSKNIPCISLRLLTISSREANKIIGNKSTKPFAGKFLYVEPKVSAQKMYFLWNYV